MSAPRKACPHAIAHARPERTRKTKRASSVAAGNAVVMDRANAFAGLRHSVERQNRAARGSRAAASADRVWFERMGSLLRPR